MRASADMVSPPRVAPTLAATRGQRVGPAATSGSAPWVEGRRPLSLSRPMTGPAAQPYSEREMRDGAFTGTMQRIRDPVLGVACLAVAEAVHLGGSEAVSRNLDPIPFSVLLTALAVGPLVVRRRYPLAVLVLTLLGLLALVATRNTVGASTLGCTIAFYTAVAVGSRRQM